MDLAVVDTRSHYFTRADLVPFVNALLKGDVNGLYSLSESGHCLDGHNIDTTADQQEDSYYTLNTLNGETTK